MRHRETRLVDDEAGDPEDVEIEGARPPPLAPLAPVRALDREERVEERAGREGRREERRGVEERALRRAADRRGLARLGPRDDVRPRERRDRDERGIERRAAVSEVRPEPHDDFERHGSPWYTGPAVQNLSLSELVLTCIIFGFVMAAGRVGKLGAVIARAIAGGPPHETTEPEPTEDDD